MPVEQLIYTDRPRGKGWDPACAGYQVKACSDDLSAEARRQLDNLCMHYGDAVYVHAPRDAKDREMQWRTRTDRVNDVPDAVLREFPVIWSYDRLAEEQFALTRINYTGITHDGRFGNFLAHSLVLSPDDLAAHRFNPLSPSRANLFKSCDTSDDTALPQLNDLGQTDETPAVYQILRRQPFAQHLPAMVAALCRATPAERPVLVCLNNWQHATQLVEALLNLLPPPARARTTFCTYESDRKYLIPTSAGTRPKDMVAAHHLIVLCAEDTRRFDLRPDEYRSTFAIFNFIDGQVSEPGEISRYAEFAAVSVSDEKKLNRLRSHHELVERLQLGQDLADWNELVAATPLSQPKLPFDDLIAGVRALVAVARQPHQADVALTILRPHVQRLADDDRHAELQSLASEIVTLSDRSQTYPLAADLFTHAQQAFSQGQGRTATALLNTRGSARDNTLIALLDDAIRQEPRPFQDSWNREERERIIELLLDGLQIARGAGGDKSPLLDDLLTFSFRKANEMGMAADFWYRGGGETVKARFSGEPDEAQPRLIEELAALLPVNQCPEASAWLNLCRLRIAAVDENELISRLEIIAYAGSQCGEAEAFADEALQMAAARLERTPRRAEALGRMNAAAHGTASAEKYLAAYRKCKAGITEPQQLRSLRISLAEAGADSILVPELLDETLPWGEESEKGLKAWLDCLPKSNVGGAILNAARLEVASLLPHRDKPMDILPLAETLLTRGLEKPPGGGTVALGEALAFALPLGPLKDRPYQILQPIADHLGREAQDRLRLLDFLRTVLDQSRKPDWAPTKFPADQPVWRTVAALPADEKNEVVSQCLDTFQEAGITTTAEAQALVRIFSALGDRESALAESVAGAVHHLLTAKLERDQTTQINVAMTFVYCALGEHRDKTPWGRMLRAIVEPFDRKTKRELEDHLERGFRRHDPKAEERLRRLCDDAGLSKPKSAEPAKTAQEAKSTEPGQRNASLFGKALGWLGKKDK